MYHTARERQLAEMSKRPSAFQEAERSKQLAKMIADELTKGKTSGHIPYNVAAEVAGVRLADVAQAVRFGNVLGDRKKRTVSYSSLMAHFGDRPTKVVNTDTTEPEDA